MIEDGHLHVILARQDIPVLHLHAMQDLVPKAVIIPLPPNEGITQDLLHPATEGTVKKDHTLGRVVRDHIHVLHPIMAQGAAAKVQPGPPRVGAAAKVLTMKSTQGNQMEIGLLVSEPFERRLLLY